MYISDGDKVLQFGRQFGLGRNNPNITNDNQEEGSWTSSIRTISTDAKEWDAQVEDLNHSNINTAVHVFDEDTNKWETLELEANAVLDFVTREQKISLLDGQKRRDFTRLENHNFGNKQTLIEDLYLDGLIEISIDALIADPESINHLLPPPEPRPEPEAEPVATSSSARRSSRR